MNGAPGTRHPSSRIAAKALAADLGEDWRSQRGWEVEGWFERLPMYLLEEPKRPKVVKALSNALALVEKGSSEEHTQGARVVGSRTKNRTSAAEAALMFAVCGTAEAVPLSKTSTGNFFNPHRLIKAFSLT
jgi:hypothetical protein